MSEAGKQRALEALRAAFATQGSDGLLDRALAVQVGMDYLLDREGAPHADDEARREAETVEKYLEIGRDLRRGTQ